MRRIIAITKKDNYKVPNWLLGLSSEEEQDRELDGIIAQITPPKPDYRVRNQFMRWVLLGLAGGKCVLCDSRENLDFHHKDMRKRKKNEYSWRGNMLGNSSDETFWSKIVPEAINDCVLLCRSCHVALHRKNK